VVQEALVEHPVPEPSPIRWVLIAVGLTGGGGRADRFGRDERGELKAFAEFRVGLSSVVAAASGSARTALSPRVSDCRNARSSGPWWCASPRRTTIASCVNVGTPSESTGVAMFL
jgi:hypothetical protein